MRSRKLLVAGVLIVLVAVLLWAGARTHPVPDAHQQANEEIAPRGAGVSGPIGATPEATLQSDLTIRGQVLGRDGPVAGATVLATTSAGGDVLSERHCQCGNECGQKLLECGCGEAAGQLMELVAERRGEVQPIARATTDGDGRFLLPGLSGGTYAIWAEAPRVGAAVAQGIRAGDADVTVKLGAGIEISGTVKREDGRAVTGAVVTGIYAKHSRFFEVATQADGSFSLGSLPEGDYTVVASAAGLLPSRERVTNGSNRKVQLELATPRSIAGRVTLDGAPANGAAVSLRGEHKRQEIRTAPDGAFAFGSLRPGRYELRAAANDRVAQKAITIAKGNSEGLILALRAGIAIKGKVVDEAGAAVGGVRVTADEMAPSRRTHVAVARSSPDGGFQLGPLEPGEFELTARLEGYVRGEPAKVVAVENATAELVILRARPIRGRVVGPDGSPLREVWVSAVTKRVRASRDDEKASARTAEDGSFALDVPRGEYEITTHPDGFKETRIPVRAPASGILVRLERGSTIEGDVVDEDDLPVAQADIAIAPESGDERTRTWTPTGRTDRDGHFVISGLGAGPVLVIAGRPGDEGEWWTGSRAHARVDVPVSGSTTAKIRFEAALAISGSVVGPDGIGLPEAKVHAWASQEGRRAKDELTAFAERSTGVAVTDRGGRFTVRGLKSGEHMLLVQKEGFDGPRDAARARAGDSNVRVVLAKAAFLRGRVLGDGGAPILRFRVNGEITETSEGRFALPLATLARFYLGSGRPFPVRVSADGFASAERSISAERGVDVDLGDIILSVGRTISGVVVDAATGGPIAAARVRAIFAEEAKQYLSDSSDYRPEGLVVTGVDGTFTISHVGEAALLRVAREGYAPATAPVGPDQGPLRVGLGRGGAIAIRILAASGEPMSEMELAVTGRDGSADASSANGILGVYGGKTDASGRYEVSGLLAGTYAIHLNSRDRNPGLVAQPVVLRDGQRVEVELKARQAGTTLQLSLSGPGANGTGELHVGLLRGVVPQITGAQDFMKIGTPIQPREDDAPEAPVFEPLEPGTYTALIVRLEGEGIRVFTQRLDVGLGPREQVDVFVPANLPLITR